VILMLSKRAALVAVFLCLNGCAQPYFIDKSYPAVSDLPAPKAGLYKINLHLLPALKAVRKKCRDTRVMACAFPSLDPCLIYMYVNDFDGYVTHETRHCTNGFWHKQRRG